MLFGVNAILYFIKGYIIPFPSSVNKSCDVSCLWYSRGLGMSRHTGSDPLGSSSSSKTLHLRPCHRDVQRGITLISSVA